ncbi:MAG: hypothetical protein C6Y22_05280 [Hapalosiphonaceae cyanobacterium JJU2]|nr:MAG: hypothetical protein C6Y22_05280 [Hapalosiphonaceae cyanobacterium JJU2]
MALNGAYLSRTNLTGANLTGVFLFRAILSRASLSSANLSSANLSSANLSSANLTGANLTGASLSSANLSSANLTGANLTGAKFGCIKISETNNKCTKLSNVKNLTPEQVKAAQNWQQACYGLEFRETLGLPPENRKECTNIRERLRIRKQLLSTTATRSNLRSERDRPFPLTGKIDINSDILDFGQNLKIPSCLFSFGQCPANTRRQHHAGNSSNQHNLNGIS